MQRFVRTALRFLCGLAALAALVAGAAPARAAGQLDGAWVAVVDPNRTDQVFKIGEMLGFVQRHELWLIEGQDVRVFGPNKVYRVQSVEPDGMALTAVEDWLRTIDLTPATTQRRPDAVTMLSIRLDPARREVLIMQTQGAATRTLVGRLPAGTGRALVAAAPPPPTCPDTTTTTAALQQQLTRAQQETAQCRTQLQQASNAPRVTTPPTTGSSAAPPTSGCPAFPGPVTAIRIDGATDQGGRLSVPVRGAARSVTLRGRSGFQNELASVQAGGRTGALDTCGVFAVTAFFEPSAQSVTVVATSRDNRRAEITIDLKRE